MEVEKSAGRESRRGKAEPNRAIRFQALGRTYSKLRDEINGNLTPDARRVIVSRFGTYRHGVPARGMTSEPFAARVYLGWMRRV